MKVPQYENQVGPGKVQAAQPGLHGPVQAAFGQQLAQAGENMSRAFAHGAYAADRIGDTLQRQQAIQDAENQRALERQAQRDKNLRKTAAILAWRQDNDALLHGKMNDDGSRVEGGLLTKEYGDAAGITKTYDEQARELMKKHLESATTPEEQEEWMLAFQQDFQNNFDTVAQYQYKQQRAQGDLLTKAYVSQQEGLAGAVRDVAAMRKNLDDTYKEYVDNAKGNGLPAQQQQLGKYVIANKNVTAAVEGAVLDSNIQAARSILDGVKNDLLPDDYNKLNNYVNKAQETLAKASQEERAAPLYERALVMAEKDPETLQEEIVQLLRNPASALGEYQQQYGPLKAKQLVEYAKWVQTNLLDSDDTRSGQIKAQNWQEHENGFNAFNWEKKGDTYKIKNKDMRNPQTVLAAIGALQGHIDHHDFGKEEMKQAQKDLAQLRGALGNMDIKANDTVLGEVVRQANILSGGTEQRVPTGTVTKVPVEIDGVVTSLTKDSPDYETYYIGGILSPEEKGIIIEQSAQFLQAANVNLLAEDRQTKQAAVNAVQAVARDYVRSKFGIVRDDVTDVQVGNNTFKSYGIKPNPTLGASITSNLDGYRYEEENGVAYLIKRDKRGNVLHRQLL